MPTTYAIPDGRVAMAATTYSGNSGTIDTTYNFQPDMVWYKCRSNGATDHYIFDTVRGANNAIYPDLTSTENSNFPTFNTQSFITNGSRIVYNGGDHLNASGRTYVNWSWKAGGTAVSNTAGSITSSVSANTTAGFSVVTYTGNGTAGATIGHGLGVAPSMVIVKVRNAVNDWCVYHVGQAAANASGLYLNLTNASVAVGWWNSTTPTSTVFTLGSNAIVNNTGSPFVAYCFAPVAGYSAFGKYTGNGSTDGPFVYLGFRPRYLMIKQSSAAGSWVVFDTARNPYNQSTTILYPHLSNAEATGVNIDILSNGFKIRHVGDINVSGNTTIYACFAENPFAYSNAR